MSHSSSVYIAKRMVCTGMGRVGSMPFAVDSENWTCACHGAVKWNGLGAHNQTNARLGPPDTCVSPVLAVLVLFPVVASYI